MALIEAIGMAVRAMRRDRDWSIERLATRADVSYQYLSEVETGKRNLSITVLERLALALGVSLSALVAAAEARQRQVRVGPRSRPAVDGAVPA
jgi:transcriptional regulator with XRE-family HTH domain